MDSPISQELYKHDRNFVSFERYDKDKPFHRLIFNVSALERLVVADAVYSTDQDPYWSSWGSLRLHRLKSQPNDLESKPAKGPKDPEL